MNTLKVTFDHNGEHHEVLVSMEDIWKSGDLAKAAIRAAAQKLPGMTNEFQTEARIDEEMGYGPWSCKVQRVTERA